MSNTLLLLIFIACLLSFNQSFAQQTNVVVAENSQQIEQLYLQDSESLNYQLVVDLSTKIVQNRKQYNKEIIAKAYALLAEVAGNTGDSARAFQFAVDGLTYKPLPAEIQLNLETKIAEGYYVKGKYHNVFHFVENVLALATETGNIKYQLLALSYRAMANALIGELQKANQGLARVHSLMAEHQQYAEYLELLEIMSVAYHHLGDYQTAVEMHERIIKLRFAMDKLNGIESTYYNLASAFRLMGRLDDAYNAYWEVKQVANEKQLSIKRGYAELGIGEVLYEQGEYQQAYKTLIEAESSFKGQNLNKPYLSVLIALAKVGLKTERIEFSDAILKQAESLAEIAEVTKEQIDLFYLLAQKYDRLGDQEAAHQYLKRFVRLEQQFFPNKQALIIRTPSIQEKPEENMAIELAKIYQAHAEFSEKFSRQNKLIVVLTLVCILLFVAITFLWLITRTQKRKQAYHKEEQPKDMLADPAETKLIYHRAYKKARKFECPLTIGYIVVNNWSDLEFNFNRKTINEVKRTLAILVNEHIGEFDQAGELHKGEFIVIFPHQSVEAASQNFNKLKEALKLRFFANLGDFSVSMSFSIASPYVQDIDPYIFLSRLSDLSPVKNKG